MTDSNVFVNCPFDEDYRPLFEVLLFTVAASGYRIRCALDENDSGDIRFDKLCRLVEESERSIHDLSRTETSPSGLPRFNMPFELGLVMGAKRFGGKRQRRKTALIMVAEPYRLPLYLSDLAGNDPAAHHGQPEEVIRAVRRYLHAGPDGTTLPGATRIAGEFKRFQAMLPELGEALGIAPDEMHPYREYKTYLVLLEQYLSLA